MTQWYVILPVAIWTGSASLPAHALQIRASAQQGVSPAIADLSCAADPWSVAPLAPLPAASHAAGCPFADAPWLHDLWDAAVLTAAAPAGSLDTPATPPLDPLALLAAPPLPRADTRDTHSGWPGKVLAGLVTVGLVMRRRLAWHARCPGPAAWPPAAPAQATSRSRHPLGHGSASAPPQA